MHRIDTPGSVDGLFQDGNPVTGQQATQLLAAWFNDVQENICHVIEEAGIELAKGDAAQLAEAIVALVAGVVGDGAGAVATTRLITGGGLVTGGGSLAADRVLTVTAATLAEVAAQVRTDRAVTPAGLAGLLSATVTGSSFVLRMGPFMLMKATATANPNATTIINLPDTFPTEALGGWCNGGAAATNAQDNNPYVNGTGVSTVSVFSALDGACTVDVFVFGR